MQKLKEYIDNNTVKNTNEVQNSILSMICTKDDPIELTEGNLFDALNLNGEFLVLNLSYSDFEDELRSQKIKYKISQSLSVIVRYEDDSGHTKEIENFIKYIYEISDDKQNSTFGIKKVDKLSNFPITILFSGILPINQLRMTIGKKIGELIFSDDEYFKPRFIKFRDDLSKELGIAILPIFPIVDKNLNEYQVRLIDLYDGRLISEFEVTQKFNKETIEIYLIKLFYIFKVLAQEKACK